MLSNESLCAQRNNCLESVGRDVLQCQTMCNQMGNIPLATDSIEGDSMKAETWIFYPKPRLYIFLFSYDPTPHSPDEGLPDLVLQQIPAENHKNCRCEARTSETATGSLPLSAKMPGHKAYDS